MLILLLVLAKICKPYNGLKLMNEVVK